MLLWSLFVITGSIGGYMFWVWVRDPDKVATVVDLCLHAAWRTAEQVWTGASVISPEVLGERP